MSKLQKIGLGVLVVCLVISAYGNYSLMKMKKRNDAKIAELTQSIGEKSDNIRTKELEIDDLLDKIKDQSSEILELKNFKPKKIYIKVKDKDTVKANEYNKIVVDLDLCMSMNDDMMESVRRIKNTADITKVRFNELKKQLDERETEHNKLIKLVLSERDELYHRLSRKWFLVIGPSVSISSDFTFRFSLSLTYGKKIL